MLRKEIDFQEVLSQAGFQASVEALDTPNVSGPIIFKRHPDLEALENRFVETLTTGGEVAVGLNPKAIRAISQFAHRSRVILRYRDPQPSIGQPAIEVDAVIGPATNSKTYDLELITLGKRTQKGLWVPDIAEDEVGPLLHGLSAMPAADEHGLKDEVSLIGRHGAGIVAAIDKTPIGAYLNSQGAASITYGPDVLEDPTKNNGARGFWGIVSASPDNLNATLPVPGEVLPKFSAAEVAEDPNHWARTLKIVLRPQHLDPIELQAQRITPNLVKPHPEISLGDAMLTQVARNLGGVKAAASQVKAAAEMTRQV